MSWRSGGWLCQRISAFRDAARGFRVLLADEPHARFHAVATVLVLWLGFWLEISAAEWCAVILAIGMVWVGEAVNTAIEAVVDLVSPERHALAGKAKDIAAGAVLLAAVTAASVGGVVFLPKLWRVLSSV